MASNELRNRRPSPEINKDISNKIQKSAPPPPPPPTTTNKSKSSSDGVALPQHKQDKERKKIYAVGENRHEPPALNEVIVGSYFEEKSWMGNEKKNYIRVVNWNIERGYERRRIIQHLMVLRGDIILLQELDWGCKRTDDVSVVQEIAKALKMHYVFVVEFEELYSKKRSARLQGGGVHGNAILSRYPLRDCRLIRHTSQPFDWGDHDSQPRVGGRVMVVCTALLPFGAVRCVSVHLENFCTVRQRIVQFEEVLRECGSAESKAKDIIGQIVAGDFNTFMTGFARLITCCDVRDPFRFGNLGISEASYFFEHALHGYVPDAKGVAFSQTEFKTRDGKPCLGLYDPFDIEADCTIRVGCCYKSKIDWILVRGLRALAQEVTAFGLSDHACLHADFEVVREKHKNTREKHKNTREKHKNTREKHKNTREKHKNTREKQKKK